MEQKEISRRIRKAKDQNKTELDFSKYHFANLPADIGELKNLRILDLSKTGLAILPPEIGQLKNLRVLKLAENKLTSLPEEIGQLENLAVLNLSNNKLANLHPSIGKLVNLRELSLDDNQIRILPSEIGQLTKLVHLHLSHNPLNALPAEIGQLTQLTHLILSGNLLNSMPVEIGQLTQLRFLNLQSNIFHTLPKEIMQLSQLKELFFSHNQISVLPAEIIQLTQLTKLYLGFSQLNTLPAEIGQLTQLTMLYLVNNLFSTLPSEIQNLKNLKSLRLEGNLLPIPPEILNKDKEPQTILNYYFSTLRQNKKPLNETKLLVLGQGTVGKTSLIQRIVHDRFDEHENKTEGIAIEKWEVEQETGNQGLSNKETPSPNTQLPDPPISVNIWDFGGQEIMHATHQFFLTKRSLYLLVLDSRSTQEENRVEYWLKIIQSFGGESPVLLVGNKSDQHPLDIDRSGLQKKYPNIIGILETSAATGAGIDTLKAVISEQVNKLPHVHDMLPESWFNVKQRLEGECRNHG